MKICLYIVLIAAVCLPKEAFTQSLDSLIAEAAQNNDGLKAKYKYFEATLQSVSQAEALPNPSISLGYFISPVETRVGPQRAKISLSQMFPWFGVLKERGNAAALLTEVAYLDFEEASKILTKRVELAYYALLETQELAVIEEENIELLKANKQLATVSFSSGKGALADAIRADIMIDMALTRLKLLGEQITPLKADLNAALGRSHGAPLQVAGTFVIPNTALTFSDDSLSYAPKVESLKKLEETQGIQLELAKKQGLPSFGIGLDYAIVSERTDVQIPDNGKDVLMPMVNMSIPLWRKKYKSSQQEASLKMEAIALQRQDLETQLKSNYERWTFNRYRAFEMHALYAIQVEKSIQLLKLLTVAYQNTGAQFEELLRF